MEIKKEIRLKFSQEELNTLKKAYEIFEDMTDQIEGEINIDYNFWRVRYADKRPWEFRDEEVEATLKLLRRLCISSPKEMVVEVVVMD